MTGQIDRDPGPCGSAILPDAPWIVADAATDPRTIANPLVAGEVGLADGAVRRVLALCQFDKRVPIVDAAPGSAP